MLAVAELASEDGWSMGIALSCRKEAIWVACRSWLPASNFWKEK